MINIRLPDQANCSEKEDQKGSLLQVSVHNPALHVCKYSKTCLLWTLVWTATCLVGSPYEVNLLSNFIDLMFNLTLFCKAICLLQPIFAENFRSRSKQVLLYSIIVVDCSNNQYKYKCAQEAVYCNNRFLPGD